MGYRRSGYTQLTPQQYEEMYVLNSDLVRAVRYLIYRGYRQHHIARRLHLTTLTVRRINNRQIWTIN